MVIHAWVTHQSNLIPSHTIYLNYYCEAERGVLLFTVHVFPSFNTPFPVNRAYTKTIKSAPIA